MRYYYDSNSLLLDIVCAKYMPKLTVDPNTVMTPGRVTRVDFDVDETYLTQAAWGKNRSGGEIARPSAQGMADESNYVGCYFWPAAQCWTLKPVQIDINNFSEFNPLSSLITLDRWYHKTLASGQAGMTTFNSFKRPDDLNTASSLFMAATSDPFIKKGVPADGTWNAEVTTAYRRAVTDVLLDRVLQSIDMFRPNQGFFLRWIVPGTVRANPYFYMQLYFGQYCLAFAGSGHAHLYEIVAGIWKHRHKFRHSPPGHQAHEPHNLAIWPYTDQGGRRFIMFANASLDAIGYATGMTATAYDPINHAHSVYSMDSGIRGADVDTSPGYSTSFGYLEVDMRRDLRIEFQASTLQWGTNGTLIDLPDAIPPYLGAGNPLSIHMRATTPPGTSINGNIKDADTFGAFVDATSRHPYAQFDFVSDNTDTPILWEYRYQKDQLNVLVQPGKFTPQKNPATPNSIDATGPSNIRIDSFDGTVQSQRGSVTIQDCLGQYPRLKNRGQFATKAYVKYTDPAGVKQDVVIHRGRCIRPTWTKRGKPGRKGAYPNAEWREYLCPLVSMWERLNERVETTFLRKYALDEASPNDPKTGVPRPWKVTAKIRDLLLAAGFPPSQIAIGADDNPIRLWEGSNGSNEQEWFTRPTTGYAEIIQMDAKNFLGGWVYFDENSSTDGQWKILFAPPYSSTPIAHFVTSQADPHTPPHLLGRYPADTYPVFNDEQGANVPPDFNLVYVECPVLGDGPKPIRCVNNWINNPVSCHFPGTADLSDPTHPDWLGHIRFTMIVDPTLAAIRGKDAIEKTQAAVDWTMHRIYDFTCHGQRLINATAPYVFVKDATIANKYRPLRYQDLVTYNGVKYYIRSAVADIQSDMHQIGEYEFVDPLPGVT